MIQKRRPVATIIILVLQAMYEAVKDGDIDLLEDLLEKPNADINMVYVSANQVGGNLVRTERGLGEHFEDRTKDFIPDEPLMILYRNRKVS